MTVLHAEVGQITEHYQKALAYVMTDTMTMMLKFVHVNFYEEI